MKRTDPIALVNMETGFSYWFTGEELPLETDKAERGYLLSTPKLSLWLPEFLHPSKWGSCPRRMRQEPSSTNQPTPNTPQTPN